MSSREFNEWMAYYQIEPWGEERDDYRSALVASTVHNSQVHKKKDLKKVDDFLPKFGQRVKPEQSVDQMLAVAEALTIALGGQPIRKQPQPTETP